MDSDMSRRDGLIAYLGPVHAPLCALWRQCASLRVDGCLRTEDFIRLFEQKTGIVKPMEHFEGPILTEAMVTNDFYEHPDDYKKLCN